MRPRVFCLVLWVGVVSVVLPGIGIADVISQMPDFYAEPGLNPFREQVSANADERIDPFSGSLHLGHVDLFIPGNGGLDIKIQRSYNSNDVYFSRKREGDPLSVAPNLTELLPRTPYGVGWSLHFGRVLKSGDPSTLCNTSGSPNDTLDNPILQLPDGSEQILFVNSTSFGATYITKEQWVASCITGGLLVISPEGMKYTMNFLRSSGLTTYTSEPDNAWYTTRIEDRNGNFLTITYNSSAPAGKEPVFNQITSSDDRTVTFHYTAVTDPANIRLNTITANGQTWTYFFQPISGTDHYHLSRVAGPKV